jgi:hypothetical protein
MATWSNQNKSTTPTFLNKIKHGVDPTMQDLQNFTFTDDIYGDGRQLKDIPFSEFVAQVWANQSKSATPTFTNQIRN